MCLKQTKKSPETIKEGMLSSLLENVDENESGLNKVVGNGNQPNQAFRTIKNTSRPNIYINIKLYKFLTKFPALM